MKKVFWRKIDKTIIFVTLMNIGILMVFSLLFYPRFYSDMDILMESAIYGIAGVRSSYIVFSNLLIGKMLTLLMDVVPMIPWYIVFHYVCCFVSLWTIAFVIVKRNNTTMGKALTGIILMFFGFECYVEPNYMKTAVLLCVSAMFLLFYLYKQGLCQRKLYKWLCLVPLYMLLSSMICFSAFLLSGISTLIFLVLYVLAHKCEKRDIAKLLVVVAVAGILALSVRVIDGKLYERSGNENVISYRSSVEKVLLYGSPKSDDAFLGKYGMNEKQYEALKQGYFSNIDNTSLQLLKSISKETKVLSLETIKDFFRTVPISWFGIGGMYYFVFLSLVYSLIGKGRKSVLCIAWGMIFIEYFVLYICNAWDYKWIAFLVFVPASFYLFCYVKNLKSTEVKTVIVYVVVLSVVLYSKFSTEIASNVNKETMVSVYQDMDDLEANVWMMDMVEYLRGYSGFQIYEIPYVPEKVYWVNGTYGLIEPYATWTYLQQKEEDKVYKWIYNPKKINLEMLFVYIGEEL